MPIHRLNRQPITMPRRAAIAGSAASFAIAAISPRTILAQQTVLRIGGTGMALGTMRQIAQAYAAAQPSVTVQVLPSLGTSGGLAAVAAGAIELALSARALTDAELTKGLHSFAYARTPIAFVTHPAVVVSAVSLTDVARILAGQMQIWPDGTPIRLVRREPSDADWTLLRGLSPDMADAVRIALGRPGLLTVATDQENADALERLSGSFGAMSIGQLHAENRYVTPMVLDGAAPTVDALASGEYPLSRTLHIVWRGQQDPAVAGLLTYLRSAPGSELLVRLGHIQLAGPDT